jgi:hypothetical protein
MINLLRLLCAALIGLLRCSTRREAEILVLRHQLNVLKRQAPKRPNLRNLDRLLFIWLARLVPTTLGALKVVCTENWIRLDARQRLGNPARLMIELLRLILHIVTSLFKPRARLAAGILVLRQQLNVLRQQVSKRPQRSNTDRFLFVWLYRWFPSSSADCYPPAGDNHPLASRGVPVVLAQAVTQAGWQAENLG